MDEKLIHFIRKHVKRGVHHDTIRNFLLSRGYEIGIIEEHISHVLSSEKNKKHLALAAVAAISIAISFAVFYNLSALSKKTGLITNSSADAQAKYLQDIAIFNNAIIAGDFGSCGKISDQSLKDRCQNKFSLAPPDAEINSSNEPASSESDREILNKALISRNASICDEINDNALKLQCGRMLNQ